MTPISIPDNRGYNLARALGRAARGLVLDIPTAAQVSPLPSLRVPRQTHARAGLNLPWLALGGQGVIEARCWARTARAVLQRARNLGINHIDTAPTYGPSQERIAEFISDDRAAWSIASKTRARDRNGVLRAVETILRTLKTDYLDIFFMHCVETEADTKTLLQGQDAGIASFLQLRETGVIRALGASSDVAPNAINRLLKADVLDLVMIPVNPADVHQHSFIRQTIPLARARGAAVLAMQVFAGGRLFKLAGIPATEALRYALSQDVDMAVVGVDTPRQLDELAAAAAIPVTPLPHAHQAAMEAACAPMAPLINRFKDRGLE